MDLTLLSLSIKVFDFDFDCHKDYVLVFTNVYDFVHFQWLKTPMWKAKQSDIFCFYMAKQGDIFCLDIAKQCGIFCLYICHLAQAGTVTTLPHASCTWGFTIGFILVLEQL